MDKVYKTPIYTRNASTRYYQKHKEEKKKKRDEEAQMKENLLLFQFYSYANELINTMMDIDRQALSYCRR